MLTITDAAGEVLSHRDGHQRLCDTGTVSLLSELVAGPVDGGTYAETALAYDEWGSYDRVVGPVGENGRRYAVHYEYDPDHHAQVSEIRDYDLAENEVEAFLELDDTPGTPFAPDVDPSSVGLRGSATYSPRTGRLLTATSPNDTVVTYAYDALQRIRSVTLPDGGSISDEYHPTDDSYAYALAHNSDELHPGDPIDTVRFVDGLGRVTQDKHETEVFRGVGSAPEHGFTVSGALTFDALGREVHQAYETFESSGSATSFSPRDPDSPVMDRSFDALDRVTAETLPGGRTSLTDYRFPVGLGTSLLEQEVTDPLGRRTVTSTDVRGYVRVVDEIAVGEPKQRTTYENDALGRLLSVTSAGREQLRNTWDLLGRRTSTDTEDGGLVEYGYDAAGQQVTQLTANERASGTGPSRYHYSFGNLVSVDHPAGTPDVHYGWGGYDGVPATDNGAGVLVRVADGARRQTLGYDPVGHIDSETTEMVGADWKMGTLTTTVDSDWLGRAITLGLPDGEEVRHGYDHGGGLSSITGAKPCTEFGSLQAASDSVQTTLLVTEVPHETPPQPPFEIVVDGERMRVTQRAPTATPGVFTYTVVRAVEGTTAVAHAAGAGVRSTAPLVCTYRYLDRLERDLFGAPAFEQVGNGNGTSYTRNTLTRWLDRQITTSPQQGGREQQDLRYTYDKVGNVVSYVNDLPPDVPSLFGGRVTQTYEYDGNYRLTAAHGEWLNSQNTRHFDYAVTYDDATGNTTSKMQRVWDVKVGCKKKCDDVVESNTYSFNDVAYAADRQHQLAVQGGKTYAYDANGNVTSVSAERSRRDLTWDAENRLTSVVDRTTRSGGKPTTYTYDHNGELAKEDKEQGRTWFVNRWVTVKNGTVWKNYFAEGRRLATKFSQDDAYEQKTYFLHADMLGSTNVVSDRAGKVFQHQEYLPTGETWVDEDSTIFRTPYQYSGEYTDEDHSLVDFGQRWFDPRAGVFYSADPLLYRDPGALLKDVTYASTYALGGGNPTSYVDPDGLARTKGGASKTKPTKKGSPIKKPTRARAKAKAAKPGIPAKLMKKAIAIFNATVAREIAAAQAAGVQHPNFNITVRYKRPAGATTKRQRMLVNLPGAKCTDCNATGVKMVADHIIPVVVEYYVYGHFDYVRMRSPQATQPQCERCSNLQSSIARKWSQAQAALLGI